MKTECRKDEVCFSNERIYIEVCMQMSEWLLSHRNVFGITEIKIAFRKPKEASLFPFVCLHF